MIDQLTSVSHQPFDNQYLKSMISEYRYPRNKISNMLKAGEIIALKNGLYILSEKYGKPLVLETVANLLYGPSYISLDYALAHYGLIPEFAYQITSVTNSRKKVYETAIGTFTYQALKDEYYNIGYILQKADISNYLIASPEKALCDKIYLSGKLKDYEALEQFLYEDLRFDSGYLHDLDFGMITEISNVANSNNIKLLVKIGS